MAQPTRQSNSTPTPTAIPIIADVEMLELPEVDFPALAAALLAEDEAPEGTAVSVTVVACPAGSVVTVTNVVPRPEDCGAEERACVDV